MTRDFAHLSGQCVLTMFVTVVKHSWGIGFSYANMSKYLYTYTIYWRWCLIDNAYIDIMWPVLWLIYHCLTRNIAAYMENRISAHADSWKLRHRVDPGIVSKYRGCWWTGHLRCHVISSHGMTMQDAHACTSFSHAKVLFGKDHNICHNTIKRFMWWSVRIVVALNNYRSYSIMPTLITTTISRHTKKEIKCRLTHTFK